MKPNNPWTSQCNTTSKMWTAVSKPEYCQLLSNLMHFTIHHEYLRKGINNTTTPGKEKPKWFMQLASFSPKPRFSADRTRSKNYSTALSLTINYFDFKGLQGVCVWYTHSKQSLKQVNCIIRGQMPSRISLPEL